MRNTWAMVCLAVAIAGCHGDSVRLDASRRVPLRNATRSELAETLHRAAAARDTQTLVQLMHDSFRASYETMLAAETRYIANLEAFAALVDQKIGPAQGEAVRRKVAGILAEALPDPLAGAVRDGAIDWSKVEFYAEGEGYRVEIAGAETEFSKQFLLEEKKGAWFFTPRMTHVPQKHQKDLFAKGARQTQTLLRDFEKELDQMTRQVKSGQINKDNFDRWKMDAPPARDIHKLK